MTGARGKNRVLVIQSARLGDYLQSTPLTAVLKRTDPEARLSLLAERSWAGLARKNPDLDEVLEMDPADLARTAADPETPWEEKIKGFHDSLGNLALKSFDRVINLNTSRITALTAELVRADQRDGPRLASDRQTLIHPPWARFIMSLMTRRRLNRFNLVDLYLAHADPAAPRPQKPATGLTEADLAPGAALVRTGPGRVRIGLQLASRHPARQWPLENFARLALDLIEDQQAGIVLVGSEAERAHGDRFLQILASLSPRAPFQVLNLMGRTSLEELAGVLSELDLLATTDTGPSHLASAFETPILGLFMGPAFCHETGPYGRGHGILQAWPDCAPCLENQACPHQGRCRFLISPRAAFSAALNRLHPESAPPPSPDDLGPEVKFFVSDFDDFGLVYDQIVPKTLDEADLLALALREAGRAFLRPGRTFDFKPPPLAAGSVRTLARTAVERLNRLAESDPGLPVGDDWRVLGPVLTEISNHPDLGRKEDFLKNMSRVMEGLL